MQERERASGKTKRINVKRMRVPVCTVKIRIQWYDGKRVKEFCLCDMLTENENDFTHTERGQNRDRTHAHNKGSNKKKFGIQTRIVCGCFLFRMILH